ncbi:MAG TPA: SLC13 family permease [Thermoplasmata archaeon]|nr:SLC13 family permease [Thermoplasmata archaeon]
MDLLAAGLLAAVFLAVIVRQLTGRGPSVWIDFALGGAGALLLGVLPLSDLGGVLDSALPVLLFLLALFVFARALESAGALDHLARWLLGRAKRADDLPALVFVGFGIASAFLLNDALVLIGVPVLLAVARRARLPPVPLLLSLAFAVTVGSVLTPFGNPQNLLVALASGLSDPVAAFLRYLLVPTAVNLAIGAVYLRWAFRARLRAAGETRSEGPPPRIPMFPSGGWGGRLARFPVLAIFPATMVALLGGSVVAAYLPGLAVPSWEVALGGAALVVALSRDRGPVVRRINWSVLVLFLGLFLVVGGAVAGGVLGAIDRAVPIPGPTQPAAGLLAIVGTSFLGPQLVSNVPWVALQIPWLSGLGYGAGTPIAWVALAGASTLAGNVTLLGAASNLIVVDLAEKQGVRIRLGEFARYALPLAAISFAVLWGCLAVGL